MIKRNSLFAGLLLLLALPVAAQTELPLITDARVPATPPGATVAAGYFTLTNSDQEPLEITGATSTSIKQVEMHRTQVIDDVARMVQQTRVVVKPGKSLAFEHGSYHLMLMDLDAPLSEGDVIDITLQTSAGSVDISMPVVKHGTAGKHKPEHGEQHGKPDAHQQHADQPAEAASPAGAETAGADNE